jgi:hypothetical protein
VQPAAATTATAMTIRETLLNLLTTLDETERTVSTLHFGDQMPLDAVTRLLALDNSSGAKAYIVSAKRKLGGVSIRAALND